MDIGYIMLLLSFIGSIYSIPAFIWGSRRRSRSIIKYARWIVIITCLFLTASIAIMLSYLINRDFQVAYVATYTDRSLSFLYTVSALWAGSSGSLLFWTWILSLFNVAVMLKERDDTITHYALVILQSIQSFFVFVLVTASNPFERLDFTPMDGMGLNPLLQDPGMALHPPTLFLGYAGLCIPFAYALSGVIANDERWILRIRKWTISSWLFLSMGIFFGAWWSYTVLGWGGYWAWDPVENASLLPWLTSTAFLHSVMIQQAKRGMRLWNIFLNVLTFEFIIFGTFMTRSGIISSVHAFGQSAVGSYFMVYMVVMLLFSLGVTFLRYDRLKSRDIFESAISKETTFLLNNLLLLLSALTILWGTIYPLIYEAVQGVQIGVGPGFYNQTQAPLFLLLMIVMGVCVAIPWRYASLRDLKRKFKYPILIAIISIIFAAVLGLTNIYTLIGGATLVFALATTIQEYIIEYRKIKKESRAGILSSILKPISMKRRRYGGYIVHIAIIVMCLGIIGSTLHVETYSVSLQKGDAISIDGYDFLLRNIDFKMFPKKRAWSIQLEIQQGGRDIGSVTPSVEQHLEDGKYIGKVDILGTPLQDIYVILEGVSQNGVVDINVKLMPLVNLIWYGGIILIIGVIVALFPRRRETG